VGGQVVLLLIGFALTTVVGGFLGFFFQARSAALQTLAHLAEAERTAALNLFEELSTLMDRRVYRMRQLCWQLQSQDGETARNEAAMNGAAIEAAMDAYRENVRDWNDRLNRNLAVAEIYFGGGIRKLLHDTIYTGFAEVGKQLEEAYRDDRTKAVGAEKALDVLARAVYDLNVRMIRQVRDGRVGTFLPESGSRAARAAGTASNLSTPLTAFPRDEVIRLGQSYLNEEVEMMDEVDRD
jgi:hypothetical protein